MSFNQQFVASTLQEAAEYAATKISQNYALTKLVENSVVTLEETQNIYDLTLKLLNEGSEDLIPENLELDAPDATDTEDTSAQDAAVDADVEASGGEEDDLNLDDLEGIVLPDSEGNQYIIQGGILVPYTEEDEDTGLVAGGEPEEPEEEESIDESTINAGTSITEGESLENGTTNVDLIEENSIFASNGSIVANLLKKTQMI